MSAVWSVALIGGVVAILVVGFFIAAATGRALILLAWIRDVILLWHKDLSKMATQFANLQQAVDTLTATVNKDATVIDGAARVLNSIPDLIQSAVNDALQKGAPPSTLSAFATLNDVLTQKGADLAAGIANVPAPPAPPAMVDIPLIHGELQTDAVVNLTDVGLGVGNVTTEDGSATGFTTGEVIRSNPVEGTSVVVGSAVDLVIAA